MERIPTEGSLEVFHIQVPSDLSINYTNCYLLCADGDALLVDTGSYTQDGLVFLKSELESAGVDWRHLRIFLTHLHTDHAGMVPYIGCSDSPVYLSGLGVKNPEELEACRIHVVERAQTNGFPESDTVAVNRIVSFGYMPLMDQRHRFVMLEDGDSVTVGGHALRVVRTPGHCYEHAGLYHPELRIFFSGDQVLESVPAVGLFPQGVDGLELAKESLQRVLGMEVDMLLAAHGTFLSDWRACAENIIASYDDQLRQLVFAAQKAPGSTGAELASGVTWVPGVSSWDDLKTYQRMYLEIRIPILLDHLVSQGFIRLGFDQAGMRRYWSNVDEE